MSGKETKATSLASEGDNKTLPPSYILKSFTTAFDGHSVDGSPLFYWGNDSCILTVE